MPRTESSSGLVDRNRIDARLAPMRPGKTPAFHGAMTYEPDSCQP